MIKNITILGAGTMGHGIAIAFARFGYNVSIYDAVPEVFETLESKLREEMGEMVRNGIMNDDDVENTVKRIRTFSSLQDAVADADYVIEAVPEIISLKKSIFGQLDEYCKPEAILASNTSGLRLADIIEDLPKARKQRSMVCHWFNPPYIIPAVELSHFGNMPDEIYEDVKNLYISIEKQPITVLKDIHGLIANRLQHGLIREAMALIESGAATPEDVERAAKYGPCFRLATVGMLEICDMNGNDVWAATAANLWPYLDNTETSSKTLDDLVDAGKLGMKSGEGFYSYSDGEKENKKKVFLDKLMGQLKLQRQFDKEQEVD